MLYLTSDHAGFRLKKQIQDYLQDSGIEFEDLGPNKFNPNDDYPDFAFKAAKKIAEDPEKNQGILICGTGQGMMMVANQVKQVRAVLAWNPFTAKIAKAHLKANILTLGGQTTTFDVAKKIIDAWLSTKFTNEERHKRRLKKVEDHG